ncbi:SOS-response transcriptional repressor LexA (RecA-mediated autopeptidase) [Pseudomonas guariconensis]|uniref:LexA family protein n=1 Tax=Pseudomonas guariconensis TaxID=1288410 RepID=UPI00088629E9|nr:S24 family peptidase [Pseudomonas guariconensis]SDC63307.1 SOS-response transcriptional repressor LexA (RecA-mediated autopeptidase) [Pseudomonas guariconensis]
MVDKNDLRRAFTARLHEALNDANVRIRGRGVDVAARLKRMGVAKTPQAVSKWLNAEAIPEAISLDALSSWLGVRREWLEYGVQPKSINSSSVLNNISDVQHRYHKVPLISWVKAGAWCEVINNFEPHHADTWLSCPVPISRSGYALKVHGDSMTNPGPGRSYPAGCIIFVDPEIEAKTGDRVIARLTSTNEATFKVLVADAGRKFLRPINPQYPIIEITEETHICGTVVGAFIPE